MNTREIFTKIDNRPLYGQLMGDRGPIVILDAGLGDASASWTEIQREVSTFARVLVYDRAGPGRSALAPTPRTCKDIIADLRHLLAAAHLQPPYILVAHSWSGINARYFANEFPNEIAGMILVDTVHENKYERFASIQTEEQNARMWAAVKDPAKNDEHIDRTASIEQIRATPRLYNFPLIVLTRASKDDLWNQIETSLQAEFLKLSTHSKQFISTSTDHFLNQTDPALIVTAIQEIINERRSADF
ncbi:MAG: alpha/beta hydrolase [Chloroflexi bacterium]|nr:alpha/beta hydrolase [Chloroflexota bacterium]